MTFPVAFLVAPLTEHSSDDVSHGTPACIVDVTDRRRARGDRAINGGRALPLPDVIPATVRSVQRLERLQLGDPVGTIIATVVDGDDPNRSNAKHLRFMRDGVDEATDRELWAAPSLQGRTILRLASRAGATLVDSTYLFVGRRHVDWFAWRDERIDDAAPGAALSGRVRLGLTWDALDTLLASGITRAQVRAAERERKAKGAA